MKIHYYGHNGSGSGYGRAADEMVLALVAAGAAVEVRPITPARMDGPCADLYRQDGQLTEADAVIVHTLPLDIPKILEHVGYREIDKPTVAYTTWEALDVTSAVQVAVREADALWVPSKATARVFDQAPDDNANLNAVHVMPHAYDDRLQNYKLQPLPPLPSGRPFTFYYVGAWSARKNPAAVLRAFCGEFTKDEPVQMIFQCRGVAREAFEVAVATTGIPLADRPRVRLGNAELSEGDLWALHGELGDVFVSASHGEAWNLPAFEAMIAGRHVIAPAGQGSDDFLEDTSAQLYSADRRGPAQVDIRMIPPPADAPPGMINLQMMGAQGLTSRCQWQEPDVAALALAMRNAYQMNLRTIDVHYDVAAEFGRKAVGQRALTLLQEMKNP